MQSIDFVVVVATNVNSHSFTKQFGYFVTKFCDIPPCLFILQVNLCSGSLLFVNDYDHICKFERSHKNKCP